MRIYAMLFLIALYSCSGDRNSEKINQNDEIDLTEFEQIKADTLGFATFLGLFTSESAETINEDYFERFLKIKWTKTEKEQVYSSVIAEKILFENDEFIGVVYIINCLAGGECATTHLAIFDTSRILRETIQVGFNFSDLAGERIMTFEIYDRDKLKLTTETIELNDNGEVIDTKKEEKIITIDKYIELK